MKKLILPFLSFILLTLPLTSSWASEKSVARILAQYSDPRYRIFESSECQNALKEARNKGYHSLRPAVLKLAERLAIGRLNRRLRRECFLTLASLDGKDREKELSKFLVIRSEICPDSVEALIKLGTPEALLILANHVPNRAKKYAEIIAKFGTPAVTKIFAQQLGKRLDDEAKSSRWQMGISLVLWRLKWQPQTEKESVLNLIYVKSLAAKKNPDYSKRRELVKQYKKELGDLGVKALPILVEIVRKNVTRLDSLEEVKKAITAIYEKNRKAIPKEYAADVYVVVRDWRMKYSLFSMGMEVVPQLKFYASSNDKRAKSAASRYIKVITNANYFELKARQASTAVMVLIVLFLVLGWLCSSLPKAPAEVTIESLSAFCKKAGSAIENECFKSLILLLLAIVYTFFDFSNLYFRSPHLHHGLTAFDQVYTHGFFWVPLIVSVLVVVIILLIVNPFNKRVSKLKNTLFSSFNSLNPSDKDRFLKLELSKTDVNEEVLSTLLCNETLSAYADPQRAYQLLMSMQASKLAKYYDLRFIKQCKLDELWKPFAELTEAHKMKIGPEDIEDFGPDWEHPFKHIEPGLLVKIERDSAFDFKDYFSIFPNELATQFGQDLEKTVKEVRDKISGLKFQMIFPLYHQIIFDESFEKMRIQEFTCIKFNKEISGGYEETTVTRLMNYTYSKERLESFSIDICGYIKDEDETPKED